VSRDDSNVDVVIVGAGPAGASAAITLARAGRRVVLIDKQQFPRDKVCGGCLSGPTLVALKALLGAGRSVPGVAGTRVTLVVGNQRATCESDGRTWLSPRAKLDACLNEAAADAGAQIAYGEPATFARGASGWDVLVRARRIHAPHVLIASGLGGLCRQVGIGGRDVSNPMLAQQWVQPAESPLPPLGAVELHWLRGGYLGLATPESGQCVVAMAVRAGAVAGGQAFAGLRGLNPRASIWDILPPDAPRRFGATGTAGFPWMPDRLGVDNVLLIGDAAGYPEPFTGAGIGQAISGAQCAASAVLDGGDVQTNYAVLMRSHRRQFRRTRLVSTVLNGVVRVLPPFGPTPLVERFLSRCVERMHIRGAV